MSENRRLDEIFASKPLIERTWFRAVLAGILLVACAAGVWYRMSPEPAETPRPAPTTAKDLPQAAPSVPRQPTVEETMEWFRSHQPLYDRIVRVAAEAAAGDAEAERLATLLRERTRLARILPGGITHSVWTGTQSRSQAGMEQMMNSTAVVLATREESGFFPGKPSTAFFFSRGDLNFVDAWEYADWYLGIVVIHELSHWDDIVVSKREAATARQFTDAWTDGELRAHAIENRLLDRRTSGGFTRALDRVLADDRLSQQPPGIPFRVTTDLGFQALLSAFGDAPKSTGELGMRGGSATIALLMRQTGDSGLEARAAYNWLLQRNR